MKGKNISSELIFLRIASTTPTHLLGLSTASLSLTHSDPLVGRTSHMAIGHSAHGLPVLKTEGVEKKVILAQLELIYKILID